MDGTRLRKDFEKFLAEHPETIIKRGGQRLFITEKLSTFCHEYDYPLELARKQLKKLGVLSGRAITIWDPHKKVSVYCRILKGDQDFQMDDLIEEAERVIDQSPKIIWRKCMWVRKQHLLPLCERTKAVHNREIIYILSRI